MPVRAKNVVGTIMQSFRSENPQHRDQPQGHERLHDGADHVLRPDQAAVEECQSGRRTWSAPSCSRSDLRTHSTVTSPRATNDCMMVPTTFFARTRPP